MVHDSVIAGNLVPGIIRVRPNQAGVVVNVGMVKRLRRMEQRKEVPGFFPSGYSILALHARQQYSTSMANQVRNFEGNLQSCKAIFKHALLGRR